VAQEAGHEPPTNQEGVKAVLRGIRRTIGTARAGKAPATADLIGQMLALCPDTMIGKRDRALLAFGFAGAFRRSELCALEVADADMARRRRDQRRAGVPRRGAWRECLGGRARR
jgi:integrase